MNADVLTFAQAQNAARYAAYRRRAAALEAADPLAWIERVLAGVQCRNALQQRNAANDPADPDQFFDDYAALSRGF